MIRMSSPATSSGFRLDACGELLVADRRAEVGEQPEVLAQAEDGLLGAQRALELVVLPVADRAEQHRVGRLRELERGLGQRVAVRLVGGTADRRLFELERQLQRAQHLAPPRRRSRGRCRHRAGLQRIFMSSRRGSELAPGSGSSRPMHQRGARRP